MDQKKRYKVVIAVVAVLFCGVVYLAFNDAGMPGEVATEQFADDTGKDGAKDKTARTAQVSAAPGEQKDGAVYIHICGEVNHPGVYTFQEAPRLIEVVESAGGFTKKADCSAVNQAESVPDGSQITIPARQGKKEKNEAAEPSDGGKININTASREELMTLNGIGESKASQIIAYRETNGAFKKIDDIMNISGIKEGVFSKIRDLIIV